MISTKLISRRVACTGDYCSLYAVNTLLQMPWCNTGDARCLGVCAESSGAVNEGVSAGCESALEPAARAAHIGHGASVPKLLVTSHIPHSSHHPRHLVPPTRAPPIRTSHPLPACGCGLCVPRPRRVPLCHLNTSRTFRAGSLNCNALPTQVAVPPSLMASLGASRKPRVVPSAHTPAAVLGLARGVGQGRAHQRARLAGGAVLVRCCRRQSQVLATQWLPAL